MKNRFYKSEHATRNGKSCMKYVDVLVDGEFEEDKKDVRLRWKGSSNQRVIDVQKSLADKEGKVYLHCEEY